MADAAPDLDALARLAAEAAERLAALGSACVHPTRPTPEWRCDWCAGCTTRLDALDALHSAAPDLARGLVAAVDALRAERDRRDALAAAVRECRATDAHRASVGREAQGRRNPPGWAPRYAVARKAWVDATAHLDALLSGAPAGVVRAGVVAEYVAAVEAHRLAGAMPSSDHPARARLRDAHRAVVAALAAVKETP